MSKSISPLKNMAVIGVALVLASCASSRSESDVMVDVKAAEATLAEFQKDPDMVWLRQNMKNAKAVLVSPYIFKAGFVWGASGGRAIVLAPGVGNRPWNGPAFYTLATASFGFQAGAQSSEVVAMFMTDKAMNSLLSTSVKLGADLSYALGPVGGSVAAPVVGDVVVFVRSKGLYGGANLDGTLITIDEKGNRAFYGRDVTPTDILIKGVMPSASSMDYAIPMTSLMSTQK
jgi:lipid-binding SYLF domain-containing protein